MIELKEVNNQSRPIRANQRNIYKIEDEGDPNHMKHQPTINANITNHNLSPPNNKYQSDSTKRSPNVTKVNQPESKTTKQYQITPHIINPIE